MRTWLTKSLLLRPRRAMARKYLAATTVAGAALALTTFTTGAHAQVGNDPPTVRVSYADLNLSTPTGQAELSARINHAVDAVCGRPPLTVNDDETAYYNYCRALARDGADHQLVRLYRGLGLDVLSLARKPAR